MKLHLEIRNARMREEARERFKHEDRYAVVEEIAKRENLAFETADEIIRTVKYGSYRRNGKKSKQLS